MKLKQDVVAKQQQKLIMTPEMLQSLEILQYNTYELEKFVKEQLLTNPSLEYSTYRSEDENNYEEYVTDEMTLRDFLLYQLQFVCKGRVEDIIGKYIVDTLDENGYLTSTVDEIAEILKVKDVQVRNVLEMIWELEPIGIAAVDLKDCLKRQLEDSGQLNDLTRYVVDFHLEDLAENKLQEMAKDLNISVSEMQEVADIIRKLDPKPGRSFGNNSKSKYIVPDVFVGKREDGELEAVTNETSLPRLMVSSYCSDILNDENSDEIAKIYLREKIAAALNLIKNIEQRRETILKVANALVNHQREFFEKGDKSLKSMTLKQIAEELSIHESTVSRTVNDKYIQCSKGIYEMKYFFSSGLPAKSVKTYLKQLVDNENPKKPYSDQKLVELLSEEGFDISRRTVAKYRDEMGILSSSKRKRY